MKLTINGVILESNDVKEIARLVKEIGKSREPLAAGVRERTTRKRWTDAEINYLAANKEKAIIKIQKGLVKEFGKRRTPHAIRVARARIARVSA